MPAKSQTQLGTRGTKVIYDTCSDGESGPPQITLITYTNAKIRIGKVLSCNNISITRLWGTGSAVPEPEMGNVKTFLISPVELALETPLIE